MINAAGDEIFIREKCRGMGENETFVLCSNFNFI
ncbi:hypothetical protein C819_03404 [Lachnospiraceae bacterium 10-1]|jgi:hypothetical protein|nr:hypothetical protein C819_03404 [Lachnospiraceae bacterium 10-1]